MTKVGQMIFEDGFEQGSRTGIQALIEACRDFGVSRQDALARIIRKFDLTEDMARKFLDEFWE